MGLCVEMGRTLSVVWGRANLHVNNEALHGSEGGVDGQMKLESLQQQKLNSKKTVEQLLILQTQTLHCSKRLKEGC